MGYVPRGREKRFSFSGDTAYFAGFKEIGKRLGPFDVAAVAIGAYEPPEYDENQCTSRRRER